MERKLVQQGNATLMVSIPSKWAKLHHLIKGSTVLLDMQQAKITIFPSKDQQKSEIEIILASEIESAIRTAITNAYRGGYDKIVVHYNTEKKFETLQRVLTTRLIGFDVTKKEKKMCMIENITEPAANQFEKIMEKFLLNIQTLIETTKARYECRGAASLKEIESIQERIQAYDNLCRRIMTKSSYPEKKREFYWTFLALMVHAGREIYHANKVITKKRKKQRGVQELFQEARELVSLLRQAYKEKRMHLLEKIHEKEKMLIYKKGYALLKETRGENTVIVYHLLASIRQFYQANSPLAGLIL